jgi:hypothetical protein
MFNVMCNQSLKFEFSSVVHAFTLPGLAYNLDDVITTIDIIMVSAA